MASKGLRRVARRLIYPDVRDFYSTLLDGASFWQPHAIGETPCNATSLRAWRPLAHSRDTAVRDSHSRYNHCDELGKKRAWVHDDGFRELRTSER
jgi:hypothetical protein